MSESPLNAALRLFEATEANLVKAERVVSDIESLVPSGIVFGSAPAHDEGIEVLKHLISALPKIDGWKVSVVPMTLDEIAQARFDAQEAGMAEAFLSVERSIDEPVRLIREYRFRFDRKRRELVRDSMTERIDEVDAILRDLSSVYLEREGYEKIEHKRFEELKEEIAQINVLIGSSAVKPNRWGDLHRHIHFGLLGDLNDIIATDWPAAKMSLQKSLYGEQDAVPVEIEDLGTLVRSKPKGLVATKLKWDSLDDNEFERLIFALISSEPGYENPEWLMATNAPDRGRDLSATRVSVDSLSGTIRQRVILQCKHWRSKSVGVVEIAMLKEQMKLWEPPRVDIHVIATSGRFSADGVTSIEKNNQSDTALRIEMWPESHLERLLASRPHIIAEFKLR